MRFDQAALRQILAGVPKVAFFVIDDMFIHRLTGGDPQVLADIGFLPKDVEGKRAGYSVDTSDVWKANIDAVYRAIEHGTETENIPIEWRARFYECACLPIREAGEVVGAVLTVRDVSHRKRNEQQVEAFAKKDVVTGLANRNQFQLSLRKIMRGSTPFAVMILDLDGFKAVNDSKGHDVGDDCLRAVAHCLTASTRAADVAARTGGDEFGLVLANTVDEAGLEAVSARIRASVAALPFGVTISLGWACFPDDGTEPEALLKLADAAMYADKVRRAAAR